MINDKIMNRMKDIIDDFDARTLRKSYPNAEYIRLEDNEIIFGIKNNKNKVICYIFKCEMPPEECREVINDAIGRNNHAHRGFKNQARGIGYNTQKKQVIIQGYGKDKFQTLKYNFQN